MKIILLILIFIVIIMSCNNVETMTEPEKTIRIKKIGEVDIYGSLHTTGSVVIDEELQVTNKLILPYAPLSVPDDLNARKNINVDGSLNVVGNTNITDKVNITGSLNVGGQIGSSGGFKTVVIDNKNTPGKGFTDDGWGKPLQQYNCLPNWNTMRCPPGTYVSGLRTTHPCGQDYLYQGTFALECTKLAPI